MATMHVSTTAVYAAATTQGPKQASRASTGPKNKHKQKNKNETSQTSTIQYRIPIGLDHTVPL